MLVKIASASCYKKQPSNPSGLTIQQNLFLAPAKVRDFPGCLYQVLAMGSRLCIVCAQHVVTWRGEPKSREITQMVFWPVLEVVHITSK